MAVQTAPTIPQSNAPQTIVKEHSSEHIDWLYMLNDTRARVYLLWAIIATSGFIATHYHQAKSINAVWFFILLVGLGFMLKVMRLRVPKLRLIYLSWLVPLTLGLIISHYVFEVQTWFGLINYLGGFWLLVLATGYFLNGLVDPPRKWYLVAALLNVLAGLAIFKIDWLLDYQYLLAAAITAWSMLNLWVFRVD